MSSYRKLIERVRIAGEADFKAGKPIDAFYSMKLRNYTDQLRGSYEMGWRGAKDEARKSRKSK